MKVFNILMIISVQFVTGLWVHESFAAIDAESVTGVWLFDLGKG